MAVEHALFGDNHAQAVGRAVDNARPHATTGAFTASDDCIDSEKIQMPDKWGPPKRAGRHFLQHSFSGNRLHFIDNVVSPPYAIEFFLAHIGLFRTVATERPWFDADPVHAGY